MDRQNALTALHVGTVDHDAAVEAARAEQRRIQHVGSVGRRDQNDPFVRFKAVHLHEELVERLLPLVVTAAEPGATMSSDGIDLVDEHDTGRVLLPLLEEVPHA